MTDKICHSLLHVSNLFHANTNKTNHRLNQCLYKDTAITNGINAENWARVLKVIMLKDILLAELIKSYKAKLNLLTKLVN